MVNALQNVIELDELGTLVEQECAPVKAVAPAIASSKIMADPRLVVEGKRWEEPVMGIDIHKKPLAWAVVDPSGIVDERETENTLDGIHTIITACKARGIKTVAMESTGEYWLLAYWTLMEAGIPVIVLNPLQDSK